MSARRALASLLAAGIALAAMTGASRPAGAGGVTTKALLDRSFTIIAEGYPVEPAPGSQSQPISIRPASSKVSIANPPATAYARAAAADLGLAEGYLGQQGPSVEADTAVEGQPTEEGIDDEGARLHAKVSADPAAEATAEIVTAGTGTSASRAAGALSNEGRLVSKASAEVRDLLLGPLTIDAASFEATATTSGEPGGGAGSGRIVVSGARVGGVPVVLDDRGIQVDETAVPLAQVRAATAVIQEAMAQGGYSDIRVVQPRVDIARDGSRVEVSGGGVAFYGTNNDPSNLYFISVRALGGRALVAVGPEIGRPGPDRPETSAPPATSGPASPTTGPSAPIAPAAPAGPATSERAEPIELVYADAGASAELRGIWPGWPWVLLGAAVALGAGAAGLSTRRGRQLGARLVDGYLRG